MRSLGGFCLALLCAGGLYAQRGAAGRGTGGGHPQTHAPTGTFGSGLATFGRGIGGAEISHRGRGGFNSRPVYGYPVFVGGFYNYAPFGYDVPDYSDYSSYSGYAPYGYANQGAAAQQQQPVIVYPPAPTTASPVIINMGTPGPNGGPAPAAPPQSSYRESVPPPQDDTAAAEPTHYLIALKDHTIYSAVAYWVDGSTLHYFTSGNTHNQVSLTLVDRNLTERLNEGSGLQVNLPPAK